MMLKIKKLRSDAVLPFRAKEGDAGLDLTATHVATKDGYVEYSTGLAVEMPFGHVGLVFPRSSISNTGLALSNSVGVIDSGYRGEIKARFRIIYGHLPLYAAGDRIAQLVIVPCATMATVYEVGELAPSDRGDGGFGSTGT